MKVFIGSHLLESVALMPPRSLSLGLLTQLLIPPHPSVSHNSLISGDPPCTLTCLFLKLYLWF